MVENQEKNIQNKIAIVTGGSRGIGCSIVQKLSQNGFEVVLNYNSSYEQAKQIAMTNSNIHIFKADVSKYEEVCNLVNFTINKFGKIDLLVNNAGISLIKTINDTTISDFDNILKTNLYSAFYTCKEVSKYMIHQKSGNIINISSIWGLIGASCEMAYSVSKAGLDSITKSLAKELGEYNIRVNAVAPGVVGTEMVEEHVTAEMKQILIGMTPLKRMATPSDLAPIYLYLASDDSSFTTGTIIQVDGGLIM